MSDVGWKIQAIDGEDSGLASPKWMQEQPGVRTQVTTKGYEMEVQEIKVEKKMKGNERQMRRKCKVNENQDVQ